MIIWNTLSGSISVFEPENRTRIRRILGRSGAHSSETGIKRYLFDRGFLVQASDDEYQKFQLMANRQHYRTDLLELTILSSEDCNFRCRYCNQSFSHGTMLPWVREALKAFVKKRVSTLEYLNVGWFGGEPLYGFEAIEDLAPYFFSVADKANVRYYSNMTTNGYLLTPAAVSRLLSWGITHYQVTIDGPEAEHNRARPTRTGGRSFEAIISNLRSLVLRDEDFRVDVRINIDKDNNKKLDNFVEFLETEFAGDERFMLRFRPVGKWGGEGDHELSILGKDAMDRLHLKSGRSNVASGLESCDEISRISRLGSQVCYAARPYSFVVGSTGKLMKCTLTLDSLGENIVGQITPEGDVRTNPGKMALWTVPGYESRTLCRQCVLLPTCQGRSCPLKRIRAEETTCSPIKRLLPQKLRASLANRSKAGRSVEV
jgi:uncharacterized protein